MTATAVTGNRECAWANTVVAYLDQDENGIRGEGELPLAGMAIEARYAGSEWAFGSGATDPAGQIALTSWLFSCDAPPEIIVAAFSPTGYRLTTPGSLSTRATPRWAFHFGLVPTTP